MLQRRKAMTDSAQPFAAKKFLEINGRRMAYIDEGEGAPIVFAHGNPTSSYLWRNVMPACRGLGRLIACDMIGMGDSEKLPDSGPDRSEEHTSELQSQSNLVCRLLLEKKKKPTHEATTAS